MTEIKLEVGKRYPTRNGDVVKIINASPKGVYEMVYEGDNGCFYPHFLSGDWAAYKLNHIAYYPLNEHNIVGHAIKEPEPQKFRDTIHPNNWKMPKIDPNDRPVELGWYVAGEKNMGSPLSHEDNQKAWEEFKKRQHVWQGGYVDPTTEKSSEVESVGNSDELKPGDVLTDKSGKEWEVTGARPDFPGFSNFWELLPKPKRLTGFVHVYENPYGDRKGYMLWDGEGELCPGTKELARIPLNQFEEGHGLQDGSSCYCIIVANPGVDCVGRMDYVNPPVEQTESCEERKKREWWLECVKPADTVDPNEEYETPLKMMLQLLDKLA